MSEATPRPWHFDAEEWSIRSSEERICTMPTPYDEKRDSPPIMADAALIVRAVNNHDELLAVAKSVVAGGMSYPKFLRDRAAAAIANCETAERQHLGLPPLGSLGITPEKL